MTEDNKKDQQQQEKRKRNPLVWVLIALLILIIIILLCMRGCGTSAESIDTTGSSSGIEYDADASEGTDISKMSQEEIQDMLNKQVEDSMINIHISTNPIFEDGKSKGPLNIVNSTVNKYPQQITIAIEDTEEIIYESKAIAVGSKIEEAKLSVNLDKGDYKCIATISSLNPTDGSVLGQAKAKIVVTILN